MKSGDDKGCKIEPSKHLYGIYNHIVKERRFTYKIAWLVLVVMAIFICIWQITDRIKAYFEYPTSRKYELIHDTNMTFPGITICDTLRYRDNLFSEADKKFIELSFSFQNIENISFKEHYLDYRRKIESLYKSNYSFPDIILRNVYLINDQTLKECSFDDRSCSAQNFKFYFSTDFELCWTFNSEFSSEQYVQSFEGVNYGLFVILDLKIKEYKASLTKAFFQDLLLEGTLKLFIHANHEIPMYFMKAKTISPGYITKARILYEKDVHMVPPHGQCATKKLHYFKNYTFSNCFLDCIIKFRSTCNCQPVYDLDRLNNKSRICDFYDIHLCEQIGLKYNESAVDPEDMFECQPAHKCDCQIPCIEHQYDATLSYTHLLETDFIRDLAVRNNVDMDYIRTNYLFLIVYYDNFIYTQSTQTSTMTTSSLISDIGGQLGLFLGASVLTLVEFLDYIINKALEKREKTSTKM